MIELITNIKFKKKKRKKKKKKETKIKSICDH
jgi:hypothetical protein